MTSRRPLPVLLLLTLVLSGCAFFGEGADARDAADKVAAALQKGDLSTIEFAGDADDAAAYEELVEPIKDLKSQVTVKSLTRTGDEASATLAWSTDVGGNIWNRTTKLGLAKVEDGWAVEWKPSILADDLAEGDTIRVSRIKPSRGRILGAEDEAIVEPRRVMRFGIDKTQVKPELAAESARRLAALLNDASATGVDAGKLVKAVNAAGPRAFVPAIVLRRAEVAQATLGGVGRIPGARAIADRIPLAPTKEFAAPILGSVGPVTAEIVEASKGRLRAGDDAGLSGLQLRYDEQLFGTPGIKVSAVPADQDTDPKTLFEVDPVDGTDVRLTLDPTMQERAEDLLQSIGQGGRRIDEAAPGVPASALVAIRPSTGEILAAASGPGGKGYNTATFGQYAPGSTFKVVSSLALLRSGLEPGTAISCPAQTSVNGKRFTNYSDYPAGGIGRITLTDAVANSCNTAFIGQRSRIKGAALAGAAAALGLGVDHDLGFPAYFGQVPSPSSETEAAADLIGQGKVLASPMAMATVLASVVEGSTVVPVLLPDHEEPGAPTPSVPLTEAEAGQLRGLLQAVVERGSGRALASLAPPAVLAKTGTAEYGDPGANGDLATHAWMIGAQGDLAVAVFVATGESGSRTAGPILKAFLETAG